MAAVLLEHALTLIARIHGGDGASAEAAKSDLAEWRRVTAAHEAAFREADARWQAWGNVSADLRDAFSEPAPRTVARRKRARRIAGGGAVMGFLISGAFLIQWYIAQPSFERVVRSATAQLARVELPDGSRIEINARTGLRVRFYRDRRAIEFEGGEAHFNVSADSARPFIVATQAGTVRVLGTAFNILQRGDKLEVTVEGGRVAVTRGAAEAVSTELIAGQRLAIVRGVPGPIERVDRVRVAAWRSGWLVFDDTPLAEALPAINAYLPTPITLSDDTAGKQRLTGSFRASDPNAILDTLPRILPVQIRKTPSGNREIASRTR